MSEGEREPVAVFMCGPDVCPKGGQHDWGDELKPVSGWPGAESVVCKKCGRDKMSCDMWSEL